MKISNSKKQLAKIIHENGGWRDGMLFSWYGNKTKMGYFGVMQPRFDKSSGSMFAYGALGDNVVSFECEKVSNWHQTILSRDEYFHLYPAPDADGWIEWSGGECPVEDDAVIDIRFRDGHEERGVDADWDWEHSGGGDIIAYRLHKPEQAKPEFCESVMRSIPEPEIHSKNTALTQVDDIDVVESKPTIEQLAADYRNAKDCAERRQEEADAAKADAEAKLAELVAAGKAIGLVLSVGAPELVITDWRDLQVGDEISVQHMKNVYSKSEVLVVSDSKVAVRNHAGARKAVNLDAVDWKFIRRP